ncbi:NHLP-related RiPP peptide [uncultured Xanthomonas sp.]|uniref:NHLP-related RiPP peptide n=2 Tax=uncultured Xanthomonas sp. TaxID=152831 RepID=UPI0025D2F654|nr:NHLP-related RiPP peptide [uncultured Xanthomonas sp.]
MSTAIATGDHIMTDQPQGHPPFDLATAQQLLTLLSTDDDFRALFAQDPGAALRSLGLSEQRAAAALEEPTCLCTSDLATKEEIQEALELLLAYLTAEGTHTVVHCFEAGSVVASLTAR